MIIPAALGLSLLGSLCSWIVLSQWVVSNRTQAQDSLRKKTQSLFTVKGKGKYTQLSTLWLHDKTFTGPPHSVIVRSNAKTH